MTPGVTKDLRGIFGLARDQAARPTCLAFALSDAHASLYKPFKPFSVDYLFFHAVQNMPLKNPHEGVFVSAALRALRDNGQPMESEWPYSPSLPQDLSSWQPPASANAFQHPASSNKLTFDEVCCSVDANHPVAIVLLLSETFYAPSNEGLVEHLSSDLDTTTHAIVAVGYAKTQKGDYLLVRNSWGTDWGMDGHAFLSRKYIEGRIVETIVIKP